MSNLKRLICPHCNKSMTASKVLRVGKEIECPKCFESFEVPAPPDTSPPAMGILETDSDLAPKPKASATDVLTAKPYLPKKKSTDSITDNTNEETSIASDEKRKRTAVLVCTAGGILLLAVGAFVLSNLPSPAEIKSKPKNVVEKPNVPIEKPQPNPPLAAKPPAPFPPQANNIPKPFPPKIKTAPRVEILPPPILVKAPTPKNHPADPKGVKPQPKPMVAVRSKLPKNVQAAVDNAINKGVLYLKATQMQTGSWTRPNARKFLNYTVGYAALPGLTLLECGAAPDDPNVQRAAHYVRLGANGLTKTYELSLAILFLDRLGDIRDRPLIQSMAMRLVAGQHENGGWGYDCPLLPPSNTVQLYTALLRMRQGAPPFRDPLEKSKDLLRLLAKKPNKSPKANEKKQSLITALPKNGAPLPKIVNKTQTPAQPGVAVPKMQSAKEKAAMKLLMLPYPKFKRNFILPITYSEKLAALYFSPSESEDAKDKDKPEEKTKIPAAEKKEQHPFEDPQLRTRMDQILRMPAGPIRRKLMQEVQQALIRQPFKMSRDDNSNSQFAMLGLWAARRHGVPTEKALGDAAIRYRASQNQDGGWGYRIGYDSSSSITGVGLLGLAMGYGVMDEKKAQQPQRDPAIQNGLRRFAQYIDREEIWRQPRGGGLYFIWTLERVAVLYNMKAIEGKDWYRWGVGELLPIQTRVGSWYMERYHGSTPVVDTCFALLFLKRSNLVQDLSDNLRFYLAISETKSESQNPEE